jgi:hypothetical protein
MVSTMVYVHTILLDDGRLFNMGWLGAYHLRKRLANPY